MVDDEFSARVYKRIQAMGSSLRPYTFILPNYPSYDDMDADPPYQGKAAVPDPSPAALCYSAALLPSAPSNRPAACRLHHPLVPPLPPLLATPLSLLTLTT